MPLSKQQLQALETDKIADLNKAALVDEDISTIIKIIPKNKNLEKLILPGQKIYKDYLLFISAVLQHSTLLTVEFANPASFANSKISPKEIPAAVYERVLSVCLAYKNEVYEQIAKANKLIEKLRAELTKAIFSSSKVVDLVFAIRAIHKKINEIQQLNFFLSFFSEKFNADVDRFNYRFPREELDGFFKSIKNVSDDRHQILIGLKNIFFEKLQTDCSKITELNLSGWGFTSEDFARLTRIFLSSKDSAIKLTGLTLTDISFSKDKADFIFSLMEKYPLQSLNLSNNTNFAPYQDKFVDIIKRNKTITRLTIRHTLSVPETKNLLKIVIKFASSSIKVIEITKDKTDQEQKSLLKQFKNNSKNNTAKHDFSTSIEYFANTLKSIKGCHQGESLTDLEAKFIKFQKTPNLVDAKKIYLGLGSLIESLNNSEQKAYWLAFHLTTFSQFCLKMADGELKLDEKLSYLRTARACLEKIFANADIRKKAPYGIKQLAVDIYKKYLLLFIKKNADEANLSTSDILLIKDYIKNSPALLSLRENLDRLILMAEGRTELRQNRIFEEIRLVYTELAEKNNVSFVEKNPVGSAKGFFLDKLDSVFHTVQGFLSSKEGDNTISVTNKDETADESPAP